MVLCAVVSGKVACFGKMRTVSLHAEMPAEGSAVSGLGTISFVVAVVIVMAIMVVVVMMVSMMFKMVSEMVGEVHAERVMTVKICSRMIAELFF